MAIPTLEYLKDRVKMEGVTFNTASTYPAIGDVLSGYGGTSPNGYANFYALGNGQVYPIAIVDEATGDYFTGFGAVNSSGGLITITDEGQQLWNSGQAVDLPVTVIVTITAKYLQYYLTPQFEEVTGTTHSIYHTSNGHFIRFNNATECVVTVAGSNSFQCWLIRENAAVTIDSATVTSINGAGSDVSISAQWKKALLYASASDPLVIFVVE